MKSHRLPPSFRYLKARLRPTTRPAFWIASLIVSVVSLGLWEVWTNPEWVDRWNSQLGLQRANPNSLGFDDQSNPTDISEELPETEISSEELDGDSLSVLLRDLNTVNAAPNLAEVTKSSNSTLPQPPTNSSSSLTPQFGDNNPFAAYSQNNPFSRLNTGPSNTLTTAIGDNLFSVPVNSSGTNPSATNEANNNTPVNPLQSALERSSTPSASPPATPSPNSSSQLRPGAEGLIAPASQQLTNFSGSSNYVNPINSNNTIPYTSPATNSYNYLAPNASNSGLPPVTVPAPITPVLPNAAGNYGTSVVTPNLQTGFNNPTPNFTSPGLQPSQFETPQSPYSIDTRIPGQTLGGGRIRTFSNP